VTRRTETVHQGWSDGKVDGVQQAVHKEEDGVVPRADTGPEQGQGARV